MATLGPNRHCPGGFGVKLQLKVMSELQGQSLGDCGMSAEVIGAEPPLGGVNHSVSGSFPEDSEFLQDVS